MKRIRLVVAYDGTQYHGWQIQPRAVTVESVLNEVLIQLMREPIQVIGASRTDSGVHARGNVAVFDAESQMPPDKIYMALNQRLPEDIRVQVPEEVPSDWHPRKCTRTKTYEYRILNRRINMPMERLYSHFCYYKLDVDRMQAAVNMLAGEHDFKSFCSVRTQVTDTVRTVYRIDVTRNADDIITIRVTGNGFLYSMVRIIAGTLMAVGTDHIQAEDMPSILEAKDWRAVGPTAPARGLTLIEMKYEL